MALIIADWGTKHRTVTIEGQDGVTEDRVIELNKPEVDPATGLQYLSNDLSRTMLKVGLEEVPSSTTYRAQQLKTMGETVKSLPPNYQAAITPFMVSLMDVPYRREVVQAIRSASAQESPEQVEQRIQQAVSEALMKAGHDLKSRELDMKEREAAARDKLLQAQTVNTGITSTFAAMQAAEKIAINPAIAPVGDVVMQQAGWTPPTRGGQDPNLPGPGQMPSPAGGVQPQAAMGGEPGDTSPMTPSNPAADAVPIGGDGFATALPNSPAEGAGQGIETLRAD